MASRLVRQLQLVVKHDPKVPKFYMSFDSGEEAVLLYSQLPNGVLDLYHTEVPANQKGKGLGAMLAKAALSHAEQQGSKVKLTCTYMQHYVSKHPEYREMVSNL